MWQHSYVRSSFSQRWPSLYHPFFSNSLDQNTILQIVLQIEIENNNGAGSDTLETASKFFNTKSDEPIVFETIIVENQGKQKNYLKNEKSILAFHPTVPTPPPNC